MAEEFKADKNLINKNLADASHTGTSFDPERRAEQEIEGFASEVQAVYEKLKPYAKSEEQKAFLLSEMQRFQSGYAAKYNEYLSSHGRVVSAFIVGPSNFPARQMNKRQSALENKLSDMNEYRDRAQAAILRELKKMAVSEVGGEVEVLKAKIAQAEELQERMKKANAIIRKDVSTMDKIGLLTNLGFDSTQVQKLLKPDYMGRKGFPSFELTNNSANIRRMQQRVGELEKKEATPSGDISFEGGVIHDNKEADRIQIFFDQKPPQVMIDRLKGEGWHWSPRNSVWQRKRTDNAMFSARRVLGLEQQNPMFVSVKEESKEEEPEKPEPEQRESTIVKHQVEALGVKVLRAKIDGYNPDLIRLTVPTDTPLIAGEVRRELARGFNGLPIPTKTWVWFKKPTESKVSVTESKITVDTSSKDYKAGYNLAIQGRIAPAVPAWTDQGKANFAQGYKDGQKDLAERSKPILTDKEPDRIRMTDAEYNKLEKKLNVFAEQAAERRRSESEEFGKPVLREQKPKVIGAPTKQEQALREAREKSHEGMRLKGQQVLTSAVSTSKRLSEFEEKEKSMVSEEKKKRLEDAKTDLEAKLAEELRLKRELEEAQRMLEE